ncbi:hypothetical protein GCM10010399_92400 [Dactylosporangium fulvum]|uniref:Secreted protein n=1 Tax=Dactylosporangium fulvum TaxID=53359 RepID=A0ABY5VNW1_9ACTN|nr:hypothetical protein [Dactylosporangium fulvum]UWP78822.1 hypothetical protein Dfulv_27015 [Dactylosporangium fulvum]
MRTPLKLGAFAAGLAAVFAASVGAGKLAGPTAAPVVEATHDMPAGTDQNMGQDAGHDTQSHGSGTQGGGAHLPTGLQVTEDGYTLTPLTTTLTPGATQEFRFRVTGPDGKPVTRYAVEHEKELHLIVVRRDLTGFRHVHPERAADGTWSVPLDVAAAGQYRVFADFRPAARAEGLTLGADVAAPGDYRPQPLPQAAHTATVDGYTVRLDGDLHAGTAAKLTFTVSRDGRPVTDLEPYLGASGHLVALREGDLAYLHVHPDGTTFTAEVPSEGKYRLYLDFKHGGTVHTAEFTAATDH